jgi:hypothetical protein
MLPPRGAWQRICVIARIEVLNNPADERRSPRANILMKGAIESGQNHFPIRVSNLSAHGALVIGQAFPERDTPVVFRCNGFAVESWVAWVKTPHAGIQFAQPIRPEELLRNAAVPAPTIVRDTRKLDFRRPGFRGNQLTPEERDELQDWLASQANEPTERVKTNPAEQESGSVPLRG